MKYRKATEAEIEWFKFFAVYVCHPLATKHKLKKMLSHIRWQEERIKHLELLLILSNEE